MPVVSLALLSRHGGLARIDQIPVSRRALMRCALPRQCLAQVGESARRPVRIEQCHLHAAARAVAHVDRAGTGIHVGPHITRVDCIDLDARIAQFMGEVDGPGIDRRLRDVIGRDLEVVDRRGRVQVPGHRGKLARHVDDACVARRTQQRKKRPGHLHHREQVGVEGLPPAVQRLLRGLARGIVAQHPGVVDQDVEPAEAAADRVDGGSDLLGPRHVQHQRLDRQTVLTQAFGSRGRVGRLATREQDVDPGLGQLATGFQADAAGGASDKCNAWC